METEEDESANEMEGLEARLRRERTQAEVKFEANLIRQEHRLIPAVRNFAQRNRWERSDPRRPAAVMAFVWLLVSRAGAATATIGVVSAISIFVAFQANEIAMREVRAAEDALEHSEETFRMQRTTELMALLYQPSCEGPLSAQCIHPTLKEAALRELVGSGEGEVYLRGVDLTGVYMRRVRLAGATLDEADLTRAVLEDCDLTGASLIRADLHSTVLSGTEISEVNFAGARLHNVVVECGVPGSDCNAPISMAGSRFEGTIWSGSSRLELVDPTDAVMYGAVVEAGGSVYLRSLRCPSLPAGFACRGAAQ